MGARPAQACGALHPFFLESGGARLFAVHHLPAPEHPVRGQVLCALPFNEEMNRSRSMVTLLARRLAEGGYGTLVVDPLGTGDSAGHTRDARWEIWRDNLRAARDWLGAQPGRQRVFLGIRLGAILAAELAAETPGPATALALWQPVTDGKLHLTQFLRVRIAAHLDRPDLPKETTAGMRESFAAGECVEVAGYELHPQFARSLDALKLAPAAPAAGTPCLWLENGSEDATIPPASQTVIDRWNAAGVPVVAQTFTGPAFWQLHERVLAPAAVEATRTWLLGLE